MTNQLRAGKVTVASPSLLHVGFSVSVLLLVEIFGPVSPTGPFFLCVMPAPDATPRASGSCTA